MTIEKLNKMDACRPLLPEPGAEVVGELIAEIRTLRDVLSAADSDIREHLQVARYNLTGMMHTGDQCPVPNPPTVIHADGIAASDRVRERIRSVLIGLSEQTP